MARSQKMLGVRFPKHLSSAQAETLIVKYEIPNSEKMTNIAKTEQRVIKS